MEWYILD